MTWTWRGPDQAACEYPRPWHRAVDAELFRLRADKALCQAENPFWGGPKRISSKSRVNFFFCLTNVKNPAIIVLNGIDGNQYAVRREPQRALGRWKRVPRRSRIHPGAADANAGLPVSRVCRGAPVTAQRRVSAALRPSKSTANRGGTAYRHALCSFGSRGRFAASIVPNHIDIKGKGEQS